MDDRVSREAVLNATKDIVNTYIKSAVVKDGENQRLHLSSTEICDLFKQIYGAIAETVPNEGRRVGLGL